MTEKEMDIAEAEIPYLAQKVFSKAYEDAINSGNAVLVSIDNVLYKVTKYGKVRIKALPKSVYIKKGTIFKLR